MAFFHVFRLYASEGGIRTFLGGIQEALSVMDDIEHAFKFNDAVLRHLTVVKKKAETAPSVMMRSVEREEARKAQHQEAA